MLNYEMKHQYVDGRKLEVIEFTKTVSKQLCEDLTDALFDISEDLDLSLDFSICNSAYLKMNFISDGLEYADFDDIEFIVTFEQNSSIETPIDIIIRVSKDEKAGSFLKLLEEKACLIL